MNSGRIVGAIDVGTSKVCAIIADMNQEAISRVLGVSVVPSHGIQKAIVSNMQEATEAIREAIAQVERASGQGVKSAYVGISGQHIKSWNTQATVSISRRDHLVTNKATKKAFELSRKVDLPEDRRILHAIPRHYILDGQPGITNPEGMYGMKLDVETHIITAGLTFALNLVKCVQDAGVSVMDLVSESVADCEAILEPEEKKAGVLLADIGCGTTDITAFKDGDIRHTSALPVAGWQMTQDLSIGLGIPFAVAEELKKSKGTVLPGRGDGAIPLGERRSIDPKEMRQVLEARVEEIFKLVLADLSKSQLQEEEISSMVLCGGGANLVGIDNLAQEVTGFPVRIARPRGISKIDTSLDDPAYATGVGLLLWGVKQGEEEVPTLEKLMKRFLSGLSRLWLARPTIGARSRRILRF